MNAALDALLFDGRSARAQPVRVFADGDTLVAESDTLVAEGDTLVAEGPDPQRWPLSQLRWPERTRHGQRVLLLPDGQRLQFADAPAFDAWARQLGHREGWVVTLQQSWRGVLVALVGLVLAVAALLQWGVPAAAGVAVSLAPRSLDQMVGEAARDWIDRELLKPSRLPPERVQQLRSDFAALLARSGLDRGAPWRIELRDGGRALGPNALALPDGSIIVTDALAQLLADRPDVLLGVVAHEWGHVHHRHGMQGVARASLLGVVSTLVLGDFSSLLAAAPVLMVQMSYSREFEREADAACAALLRSGGIRPDVMVEFFRRVRDKTGEARVPIAIASHPDDEERVRFFEQASR